MPLLHIFSRRPSRLSLSPSGGRIDYDAAADSLMSLTDGPVSGAAVPVLPDHGSVGGGRPRAICVESSVMWWAACINGYGGGGGHPHGLMALSMHRRH